MLTIDVQFCLRPVQVKRKQTSSGVALGDDVFSLVVEPNIDHSLIMGLVIVHGLMNHIL